MSIEKQTKEIVDRRINQLQLETNDLDNFAGLIQSNDLNNTVALLTALSPNGLRIVESTSGDILKVANAGSGQELYDVLDSQVSGAYDTTNLLSNANGYTNFDILVSSVNAEISFKANTSDDWLGNIKVKQGMRFIDINTKAVRVRSAVTGSTTDVQIIGYY